MIVLLPCYSLEDFSIYRTASESNQIFSSWSALYHPALLEWKGELPQWERAGNPTAGRVRRLAVIPPCCESQIPTEWIRSAQEFGTTLIRRLENRDEIAAEALDRLGLSSNGFSDEAVETFFALGFCRFTSELITRKLRYMSNLDTQNFDLKTLAAVRALRDGDSNAFEENIRRAFELLAESKQYFFPTAAKLLDLTRLSPETLGEPLRTLLTVRARRGDHTNLLLPVPLLEQMAAAEPESLALLKEALAQRRVTLVGGDSGESPFYLLPPTESVTRILDGLRVYAETLGERPRFFGRLTAGYSPTLAALLSMTGYEASLMFTADGWRPYRGDQSRVRWHGSDGAAIPALVRPPIDASSDQCFMETADRIGYGASSDFAPATVFEHRPGEERPWLADIFRMGRYADVLGHVESLAEFFENANRSGSKKEFGPDDFKTNGLTRFARENRPDPVSLWRTFYALRSEMAALSTLTLFAGFYGPKRIIDRLPKFAALSESAAPLEKMKEDLLAVLCRSVALTAERRDEKAQAEAFRQAIGEMTRTAETVRAEWSAYRKSRDEAIVRPFVQMFYEVLSSAKTKSGGEQPIGDFFVNPTAVEQTATVEVGADLPPETLAFVRSAGRSAAVTVPPFAAVWIPTAEPNESNGANQPPVLKKNRWRRWFAGKKSVGTNGDGRPTVEYRVERFSNGEADCFYTLSNRYFSVAVDAATGQTRSIKTFSSPTINPSGGLLRQPALGNRFAWQIALRLGESQRRQDTRPPESAAFGYTIMSADRVKKIEESSDAASLRIDGRFVCPDGSKAADFTEFLTVRRDSRVVEAQVELRPVILPSEGPWENYYGVRFAWNDNIASVRTGTGGRFWETDRDYLQAPEAVDIRSEDSIGVTLLCAGLPFHRRYGLRRMDTVLVTKNESARSFRFGVGLDLPNPLAEAQRFLSPKMFRLSGVAPPKRPFYRLLEISNEAIQPILLEPLCRSAKASSAGAEPLAGFRVVLQETSGKKIAAFLRTRLPMESVGSTDFLGRKTGDIPLTDSKTAAVTLEPYQILPLECWLLR